jgi:hypothetical protein
MTPRHGQIFRDDVTAFTLLLSLFLYGRGVGGTDSNVAVSVAVYIAHTGQRSTVACPRQLASRLCNETDFCANYKFYYCEKSVNLQSCSLIYWLYYGKTLRVLIE